MDFKSIKDKIVSTGSKAKNKIVTTTNKAVTYSAKKLSNSKSTIRDKKALEDTIKKSKKTTSVDKKTGKRKTHKNRVFIIFGSEKSDFFKKSLLSYPVLSTKAFSQNVTLRLAISKIPEVDLKQYNVNKIPSLVVFENLKVFKVIEGKENIQKLVNSFNLDINKQLDNL